MINAWHQARLGTPTPATLQTLLKSEVFLTGFVETKMFEGIVKQSYWKRAESVDVAYVRIVRAVDTRKELKELPLRLIRLDRFSVNGSMPDREQEPN